MRLVEGWYNIKCGNYKKYKKVLDVVFYNTEG